MYEKKIKRALVRQGKFSYVLSAVTLVGMILFAMLISCQFRFCALVIATESMTGELNKGDAIVYESYDSQEIEVGQVIVFQNGKSRIVHRVIDIEIISGETRYYTKGDANEDPDPGFITDADIVGTAEFKIPYVGYPTVWLRSTVTKMLFE